MIENISFVTFEYLEGFTSTRRILSSDLSNFASSIINKVRTFVLTFYINVYIYPVVIFLFDLMAGFKEKRAKEIDLKVLKVLASEKRPVSTRELAMRCGYNWHSIELHCMKLQLAGSIDGYKLSNLNVWVVKK